MAIGERAYLAILAIVAAERVFELFLSRRNAGRAFARGGIEIGQPHYRVMVALHTAFLVSCAVESLWSDAPVAAALSWGAFGAEMVAQALRYAAVATLGERWNTRVIVTPAEPPVTAGLYRWIRHPNYVAVVVEIFALPLIRAAWFTAIFFSLANALLLAVRITSEERALGPGYQAAFAARPRFFPNIRHLRDG
jgi:methyltransferase